MKGCESTLDSGHRPQHFGREWAVGRYCRERFSKVIDRRPTKPGVEKFVAFKSVEQLDLQTAGQCDGVLRFTVTFFL